MEVVRDMTRILQIFVSLVRRRHGSVVRALGLHAVALGSNPVLGPVSRKSRKLFGPKKPSVKLSTACFGKPIF